MKKIFKVILLSCIVMASCCLAANAQQKNQGKERLTREQMAGVQAKHIAEEMAMDDATASRFIDTYSRCQQEIWALGPRAGKVKEGDSSVKTDEEVGQELKAQFDKSQKILSIRQKYYDEYSTFLTQKQIQRVYELERQMGRHLADKARNSRRNSVR